MLKKLTLILTLILIPILGFTADNVSEQFVNSLEYRISDLEDQLRDLKNNFEDLKYEKNKLADQQNKNLEYLTNEIKNVAKQVTSLSLQNNVLANEYGIGKNESPFERNSDQKSAPDLMEPFYQNYQNNQGLTVPKAETNKILEEEYNNALNLFKAAKYYESELAFKNFLNKYNKSDLTSSAYYWLAESFFLRNKFDEAIAAYLKSYRNNPTGEKASDSLFKLSKSLTAVNKLNEACMTLYKLTKEFPGLPLELNTQINNEKLRIGCD